MEYLFNSYLIVVMEIECGTLSADRVSIGDSCDNEERGRVCRHPK